MEFIHDNINQFWSWPEVQRLEPDHKASVLILLTALDGPGGDASSIFNPYSKLALRDICVRDHTMHVATCALNAESAGVQLSAMSLTSEGLMIIAALAHDVAKMPEGFLTMRFYVPSMHAVRSAKMAEHWLSGVLDNSQLKLVLKAVAEHHDSGVEFGLLTALKAADAAGRALDTDAASKNEVSSFATPRSNSTLVAKEARVTLAKGMVPDPKNMTIPFFDALEFINRLKPQVNRQYKPPIKLPPAFSMRNDVVYISPQAIFAEVKKWAMEIKPEPWLVIDLVESGTPDRKSDLLAFVGAELKKIGALREDLLPAGYLNGAEFVLSWLGGREDKATYLPFKSRFFTNNIAYLEKYKNGGGLSRLKRVEANHGVWTGKVPTK